MAILAISEIVQKAIRALQVVELARVVLIMMSGNDGGGTSLPSREHRGRKPTWDMVILVVCLRKKDPGYAFHSGSGQKR
ncbi:MAG: hypothetical protein IPL08_13060 [Saprospiraceae bacterium]|nr:hypothetical protein [Saprospiraceae bacterium]